MTPPYFTIVIPTHNRVKLLPETLDSVWAQDFTDYEVIIVDDGSTDGTWEWLTSFGGRAKVFRQANGGPAAARNLALAYARGHYVAFLDSDDLLLPWALATYAEIIERQGQPSFLTAAVRPFNHPHVPADIEREAIHVELFRDYYASSDKWRWYGTSSFVVKRSEIKAIGGFRLLDGSGEDLELSMRLGESPGFVDIQAPVTVAYREHVGGVRHVTNRTYVGSLDLLRRENSGIFPGGDTRRAERWQMIGRHMRPATIRCLHDGLRSQAWHLYRATFSRHLRERRWRFLVGFPILAVANVLRLGGRI